MLGDEAVIADEMPLIGGEFDFDSIDVLMVVTSIEREFGVKIPNEAVGRAAFETVTALAGFVQEQLARQESPS